MNPGAFWSSGRGGGAGVVSLLCHSVRDGRATGSSEEQRGLIPSETVLYEVAFGNRNRFFFGLRTDMASAQRLDMWFIFPQSPKIFEHIITRGTPVMMAANNDADPSAVLCDRVVARLLEILHKLHQCCAWG